MRLAFAILIIAAVAALPAAAVTFNTAKFAEATGVRLDGGDAISIQEGQTVTARVVDPAVLARIGLKGARAGDAVRVLLLNTRDRKLKLMREAGGEVTFIYGDIKLAA